MRKGLLRRPSRDVDHPPPYSDRTPTESPPIYPIEEELDNDELLWSSGGAHIAVVCAESNWINDSKYIFNCATTIIPALGLLISAERFTYDKGCIFVDNGTILAYGWRLHEIVPDLHAFTKRNFAIDITGTFRVPEKVCSSVEILPQSGTEHKLVAEQTDLHCDDFRNIQFVLRDSQTVDLLVRQVQALENGQ